MNIILLFSFLTAAKISVFEQGQSDIYYIRIYEIKDHLLNREVKIDFKPAQGESNIRNEDTVQLKIKGVNIKVMERRKVGMEDWYYDDQGLLSIENLNGHEIKISKTVIKKITSEAILFEFIMEFYTIAYHTIKIETEEIWIDRQFLDGILTKRRER